MKIFLTRDKLLFSLFSVFAISFMTHPLFMESCAYKIIIACELLNTLIMSYPPRLKNSHSINGLNSHSINVSM